MNVSEVRIVRRLASGDKDRPFSEVLIVADGRNFYTRLFHPLDDSPHARASQIQDFLRRQGARAK